MSLRQLLHQTQPWRALQQPPKMHGLLSIFRAFSILRPEVPVELPRGSSSVHQVQLPRRLPCSSSDPLGSGFSIDVVDSDLWPASFALLSDTTQSNECPDVSEQHEDDEIDDMRQQKKLFYKLDRGSREFEENNVPLRRRKTDKTSGKNPKECKEEQPDKSVSSNAPKPKEKHFVREDDLVVKRERVLTFNQMTDPYHHPFCLDIHVTKGSVRACFVHRVTSRVVVVAHSISKDMKFDLGSKKGKGMKAVGALLAKRAIEDDIHNAVYTPRKGDRIEGKIEVVLHAISENGVDVKVKLKQRKPIKVFP
jgi:large subunit ribosomal protein L18